MNTEVPLPLVTPQLLRHLRNKAGLTQSELADRLGISQAVLSRYESGEVLIPLDTADRLINELGLGLRLTVDEPNLPFGPVDLGDPYRDYCARLRLLREFIRAESPEPEIGSDLNSIANLEVLVDSLLQLPRVVIAGRSDAGKSHVANCLIGSEILPTNYQPLTRIPIALIHKDHRPPFVTTDCSIMKGSFDLTILLEKSKFQGQLVTSGGRNLLNSSAVHVPADHDEDSEADWAIVFHDSAILRACVLVDTPGFAASDSDTDRAIEACRGAEIVIYCSPTVGCFNSEDHIRLNQALAGLPCPEATNDSLPVLSNFLFVITHAGPQISNEQLTKIRQDVCRRFIRSFSETLNRRIEGTGRPPTEVDVACRFVPFWGELESRHREMKESVDSMLRTNFPRYRINLADKQIDAFRGSATAAIRGKIEEWKRFLDRWEESKKRVLETESNEANRKAWADKQLRTINDCIDQNEQDSLAQFEIKYNQSIDAQNIERMILETYESQDEAKNEIGARLIKDIQDAVANDLGQRSKVMAEQINHFLRAYTTGGGQFSGFAFNVEAAPGFDAFASFAGGLVGLTTFGALAVWASLLGNLGGYIIAAKVVGVLAAIGIPTGGVAAVVTGISALGGPIVLGIALAILAAITVILFFWKSWQKRMAEKVCDEFTKQDFRSKIKTQIEKYWGDSRDAFQAGAAAVEREWLAYLDDIKSIVESDSKESIEVRIRALERLNDFFVRLPWFSFQHKLMESRE